MLEVSFSKAAYETSRLVKALIPMYRIRKKKKEAMRPMKIPGKRSVRMLSGNVNLKWNTNQE